VTGSRWQGRKVGPKKIQFARADDHIAFLELCAALPQALDFPSMEHKTRLEFLFDKVVMPRFLVAGDTVV